VAWAFSADTGGVEESINRNPGATGPASGLSQPQLVELPPDFFKKPADERVRHVNALVRRPCADKTLLETMRNWYTGGNANAVHALTAVVMGDPDVDVRRAALSALGRIPDLVVVPAMLRGLESQDRASRMHAILAFGRLRARESVPSLVALLDDRRSRVEVARTLVAIRDERALDPLRAAASRGWWWQRRRLRDCVTALEAALGYEV
jgi:hypothetical protein